MILHHLVINNFRQIYGRHVIYFATEEKNVTVLLGENAAGKTTLLTALAWCLHGPKDETGKNKGPAVLWDLNKPEQLLNHRARRETPPGSRVEVSVELQFEHDGGAIYKVTRKLIFTKQNQGSSSLKLERDPFSLQRSRSPIRGDDNWEEIGNAVDEIERMLPLSLIPFFFFKGETAGKWVDPRQTDKLREAVKNILDLAILESTGKHSEMMHKELNTELRKVSEDDESGRELENQIKQLQDDVKAEADKLRLTMSERESLLSEISQIEKALNDYSEAQPLIETKTKLEGQLTELETSIASKKADLLRDIRKNAFRALLTPALTSVQADLKQAYDNEELPARIKAGFVSTLLDRGTCICGTDISDGQSARERLVEFNQTGGLDSVAETLQGLRGRVEAMLERGQDFSEEYLLGYDEYEQTLVEQISATKEVEKIKAKLVNTRSDEVQLQGLLNRNRECNDRLVKIDSEISAISDSLGRQDLPAEGTLRHKLVELEKQRKTHHKNNKRARQLTRQIEAIKRIQEAVETLQDRWLEIVQQYLDAKIHAVYEQNAQLLRRINFTKDYKLKMKEKAAGHWVDSEPSDANQAMLALCFVAGIVELAEKVAADEAGDDANLLATGRYPMVMDAPFAKMGTELAGKVPSYLADAVPQMIIMIKDNEWEGVEATLRSHVGRAYVINLHTSHYHDTTVNLLGRKVPFVTHEPDAESDYSVIEEFRV